MSYPPLVTTSVRPSGSLDHERMPAPNRFPSEAEVPESKRHLLLRTALFQALQQAFEHHAMVGSDQFIYWNQADPTRSLAPDAFVMMGGPDQVFDSWKTWERGVPQVAVEIVSDSDARSAAWSKKLASYDELGVLELVRFDGDAQPGQRLEVWDRVGDELVERTVTGDRSLSPILGHAWVVAPADDDPAALRVEDATGALIPTLAELRHAKLEADAARREAEELAERLLAELEALRKR